MVPLAGARIRSHTCEVMGALRWLGLWVWMLVAAPALAQEVVAAPTPQEEAEGMGMMGAAAGGPSASLFGAN